MKKIGQKAIYIFEFKIDDTAEAAIKQIKTKNYAQQFLMQEKSIYLVGVNFVTADKKINDIQVEKWDGEKFIRLNDTLVPNEVKL